MEIAHILRTLWRRKLWVALGLCVAVAAAWATTYKVTFPPTFESRSIEFGSATTQVLLDTGQYSPLYDLEAPIEPLAERAHVYARLVESEPVQEVIASEAGYRPFEILISGRTASQDLTRSSKESAAEQRSRELAGEAELKRLLFAAEDGLPVLSIYAQAPTPREAMRIADAGARGIVNYVNSLESRKDTSPANRVELRQLGAARGGWVNQGASKPLAGMAFLGVFLGWCVVVILGSNLAVALRRPDAPRACLNCGTGLLDDARFCPSCGFVAQGPRIAATQPARGMESTDDGSERKTAPGVAASAAAVVRRRGGQTGERVARRRTASQAGQP
jgi:zinc-ribbon domain